MARLAPATFLGTFLVLFYTALISGADAITKFIAGAFAAPQLYAISGGLVALFCVGSALASGERPTRALRTTKPLAMALRSGATLLASTCYFYAFRDLPLAEVFIFIGLMPIFAALMSGPILGERISIAVWIALGTGVLGMLCLFPEGVAQVKPGHLTAALACLSGTFSMVMARYIGRHETNALAQVFYPNVTIMLVMGLALPFVWRPMGLADLGFVLGYAALLFGARWVSVVALRNLAAYVVTALMNLQFVWMTLLGALFFGEFPTANIFLGSAIVIGSGLFLIWDQVTQERRAVIRAARPVAEPLVVTPAE
ncbi:DMT family transporter [Pseudooceanicola sp. HF7]|uniref:DMT family transporter n=1 Tax=Pseudooceanicola sp. HF7 TaxID=2721560 RepID=UPI00142FC4D3|nr:DMT family transporter [Pseudooceanicola sp. HF7]NIZ08791.1 DMT family transporter [Pseudooceanicola sp. HF7]